LGPGIFFSFRYFSSERFSNFFFKHSLKSFYARYFYFYFIFFENGHSLVVSHQPLNLLTNSSV
jgi:hypothetical protein